MLILIFAATTPNRFVSRFSLVLTGGRTNGFLGGYKGVAREFYLQKSLESLEVQAKIDDIRRRAKEACLLRSIRPITILKYWGCALGFRLEWLFHIYLSLSDDSANLLSTMPASTQTTQYFISHSTTAGFCTKPITSGSGVQARNQNPSLIWTTDPKDWWLLYEICVLIDFSFSFAATARRHLALTPKLAMVIW